MRATTDRRGVLLAVALLAGGCAGAPSATAASSSLPRGGEPVDLDPADFTVDITNRWWPMRPGDRWEYDSADTGGRTQHVVVTVLDETRTVAAGVQARVVHDVVTQDGRVLEDTRDYYAQDSTGNIWYLGELTTEYPPGEPPSTEGSWEAGVDGAQPGIAVPAHPHPGQAYRQEHLAGEAEDRAVVLSTDEQVQTPAGHWTGALLTRETTPLEPDVSELKFYVAGVGEVLALQTSDGSEREELVRTTVSG